MIPLLSAAGRAVRGTQGSSLPVAVRAFASDAVAVGQQQNPFLRFSSPQPKALDHSPLLSTLPETKVWEESVCAWMAGCMFWVVGASQGCT